MHTIQVFLKYSLRNLDDLFESMMLGDEEIRDEEIELIERDEKVADNSENKDTIVVSDGIGSIISSFEHNNRIME